MIAMILVHPHIFWLSLGGLLLAAEMLGGNGYLLWSGVAAVVVPQCGENAANVLKEAGLKIYKTISTSVQENIDAFAEGKLALLENIHAGFHNHGGK